VAIAIEIATVRSLSLAAAQLGSVRSGLPQEREDVQLEGDGVNLTISRGQAFNVVVRAADFVPLGSLDLSQWPNSGTGGKE
jgi:hypothetical protein